LTASLSDSTALAETLHMAEVSSFLTLWFNSRRSNDPSGFGNCTMCFVISYSTILSGQKNEAKRPPRFRSKHWLEKETHFFRSWAVMPPIRSCPPLAFSVSSRSSECFGRINVRGFLSSPLVAVGKGLELIRNRLVGHGLGSAK
jgi:hypothetical protein